MIILVIFYFLVSLAVKFLVGCTIINRLVRGGNNTDITTSFVLGAVVHLLGVLLLKSLHFSWIVAVSVASVPGLLSVGELKRIGPRIKSAMSWDYMLWLALVAGYGTTIIFTDRGIGSVWENNSSDLAFHLGIISSFVLGDNFPPQYTIFPGMGLSYSFLINLWTAEWWWPGPIFTRLSVIFWSQWFVLWAVVPRLMSPSRLAPWLILFGGGSIFNLFFTSKELIENNLPWSVFFSTIWIPQRSAMFGLVVILSALRLCFCGKENQTGLFHGRLFCSGLLLGLSLLVHAHLVATCALFILLRQTLIVGRRWGTESGMKTLGGLISLLLGLTSAGFTLPFLTGKEGMVGPMAGWVTGEMVNGTALTRMYSALSMWIQSIPQVLAMVFLIFKQKLYRKELLLMMAMFLFGNFVKLAVWPWDQIKFFLGIYVILIFLFSRTNVRLKFSSAVIMLLLMLPAIWESSRELITEKDHTIYFPSSIEAAELLNTLLPKRGIVAAQPSAFSVVTLAGRFLYMGYDGTLWSHGIKESSILGRSHFQSDLSMLGKCKYKEKPLATCPGYLLWTVEEQNFWHRSVPPEEWRVMESPWLYKRLNSN